MMEELGLAPGPVRQQIAAALNLIIHTTRFPDGSRKIVKVSEVVGLTERGLELRDVFSFIPYGVSDQRRVIGNFFAGERPSCFKRMASAGLDIQRLEAVFDSCHRGTSEARRLG